MGYDYYEDVRQWVKKHGYRPYDFPNGEEPQLPKWLRY